MGDNSHRSTDGLRHALADLGELEVEAELGRGALTRVFRVRRGDRSYAMKQPYGGADVDGTLAAFRREGALLACLDHPGVVGTKAVGLHEGRPALVTELVTGSSLAHHLALGQLPQERVVELGIQLADALAVAHRVGLVHRDLNPQNIMISAEGTAKLIDFGLATLTRDVLEDSAVGTFVYTAPEQAGMLNRPVDGRSDLYSLGAVLFECLTGQPPFVGSTVGELLRLHAVAPPPDVRELRPEVSPVLATVVARLLAKDPDDRYHSAVDLCGDLTRVRGGAGAAGPALGAIPWPLCGRDAELERLIQRWRRARAGAGGVALLRGPTGIGKSHLAQALRAAADADGGLVLSGRCLPDDNGSLAVLHRAFERSFDRALGLPPALWEVARQRVHDAGALAGAGLLRPLFPALTVVLDDVPDAPVEGRDEQLVAAIAVFLAELARQWGGAVLCLDDAQWLDATTHRLLARLAAELPTSPLLILLVIADDPPGDDPAARGQAARGPADEPLRAVREDCGDALDTDLRLGPLPDQALTGLAVSRLPGAQVTTEFAAHLAARSGGLPLAAVEYLQLLVDSGTLFPYWGTWRLDTAVLDTLPDTPDGLELGLSRLQALPPSAREVLTVAAVIGNRFRLDLLACAAGVSEQEVSDAVGAAVGRRLVELREEGRYGFVHPGLPGVLREGLPGAERRRWHRRVADALDRLGPLPGADADHVYALARHHARAGAAGDPVAVYRTATAAGVQALAQLAPGQAVEHLEQALEAGREAGLAVTSQVHGALATAYLRVGRIGDAAGQLDAALALEQDPRRRAALWTTYTELHSVSFDEVQAVSDAAQGLRECGRPVPTGWLAVVAGVRSAVAAALVRRTRIGFGSVHGRRREDYLAQVALLNAGAYAAGVGGRMAEAVVFTLRALYLVNRLGPGREYIRTYATLGALLATLRMRGLAERCFARTRRMAAGLGDPTLIALVDWLQAIGLLMGGLDSGDAWEEVMSRHARWLEPAQYVTSLGTQGLRLVLRGWPLQAQACYQRALAHLSVGGQSSGTTLAAMSVMVPAQLGRPAEAAAALARLRTACADGSATPLQRGNVIVAGLMAMLEQGEFGAPFEELITEFQEFGLGGSQLLPLHKWGYVFRANGRLVQCRLAGDADRPARLAAARRAVRDVRRNATTPMLRTAYGLLHAALLQQEGRPEAALRAATRVHRRAGALDAPLVALEVARIKARALHQLGHPGEAERQASRAYLMATSNGLAHRARQVKVEFGLEDAAPTSLYARHDNRRATQAVHSRRLEALQQVSMAAATVLDLRQLARVTLTETLRIVGAERAMLFLLDDAGQPQPFVGLDADGHDLGAVTGYGSTLVQRVCTSGEAMVVTGTEEGAALGSRSVVAHGLRSIMIAPLGHNGRLTGVVYLDSRMARGIFTEDDVEVLTAITSHVAVSLVTAQAAQLELAVAIARREQQVAESLRTSLAELSAILDPAEVLDRLFTTLAGKLQAGCGVLLRAAGDVLTVTSMTGDLDRARYRHQVDLAVDGLARLTGAAPVSGAPGTAPDVVTDLLGPDKAWLAIPLRARECLVGLVLLGGDAFGDTRRDLGAALASQGMSAYDKAQLFSRVQELATIDELTGTNNRRHFHALADALVRAAASGTGTLAAAMIDIDRFKRVNDTYGHGTGDDVIREVTARLRACIRESDVLGRYGGEEFAIIFPDVADGGRHLAERIRLAVASEPVATRTQPVPVTVSIGLAVLTPGEDSLDALLARADQALYRAKEAGRNRVAVEPSSTPIPGS